MSTRRQQRARNRRLAHSVNQRAGHGMWRSLFGQTPSRTTRRRQYRRRAGGS